MNTKASYGSVRLQSDGDMEFAIFPRETEKETAMAFLFHSTILATALAATVAVGIASAAIYRADDAPAAKADRLPIVADADAAGYVTIETRHDGVSVLQRVQVN